VLLEQLVLPVALDLLVLLVQLVLPVALDLLVLLVQLVLLVLLDNLVLRVLLVLPVLLLLTMELTIERIPLWRVTVYNFISDLQLLVLIL
jgi:hypothetical protein